MMQLAKQIVSHAIWSRLSSDHRAKRHQQIVRDARAARSKPNYVVLGDSNTQAATLLPARDLIPVNAGVGGARAKSFLYADLGRRYAAICSPRLVVIALGVNDVGKIAVPAFHRDYEALLDRLTGFRLMLCLIPAVPSVAPYNDVLTTIARERSVPIVSFDMDDMRDDGKHLTQEASQRWCFALVDAIR